MSFNFEQTPALTKPTSCDISDEYFYTIIDRLKAQKALPRDSFTKEMPFFNFSSISKESQVRELFQDISDPSMYKSLIKNIISLPAEKNQDLIAKRLSAMQVMGFAQLILYKVLPCTEHCPNRPREIATHNQYKDYEYECPFYHHEKDQRRMVLTPHIEEEFLYKANYFEENKRTSSDKDKCSQNYFESMFHPLYYKMFRCKREYCNLSQFCPFFHSEEEKKTWDRTFSNFIRKDRISYVKDKQKYYEHNSQANNNPETRILRSGSDHMKPNPSSPNTNYGENKHSGYKQRPYKPQEQLSPDFQEKNEWRSDKGFKSTSSARKWDNKKKILSNRKDSAESSDSNSSPGNSAFYDGKEALNNRVC